MTENTTIDHLTNLIYIMNQDTCEGTKYKWYQQVINEARKFSKDNKTSSDPKVLLLVIVLNMQLEEHDKMEREYMEREYNESNREKRRDYGDRY